MIITKIMQIMQIMRFFFNLATSEFFLRPYTSMTHDLHDRMIFTHFVGFYQ